MICLTVYQVWATQRHERLMVRPYVRVVWYLEGAGGRNVLHLENAGLGPAIVKSVKVRLDGRSLDLLSNGMHKEFVKVLGARTKSIASSEACFADLQPESDFVIRIDRPEPLLVRSNNALLSNACAGLFALALTSGPIEFDVRYESFAEDRFELHRAVELPKLFPYPAAPALR